MSTWKLQGGFAVGDAVYVGQAKLYCTLHDLSVMVLTLYQEGCSAGTL